MPANSKYLSSRGQRALKITAAILGGYSVSACFHLLLACIPAIHDYVILISGFSFFLVWAGLMIVTFLAKNGWRIWLLYILISIAAGILIWFLK